MFLVGAAFYMLVPILAPGIEPQYHNVEVFRAWPRILTYMALYPFTYGFVFAAAFVALRHWSSFPSGIRGGCIFGASVFVVGSLPVYLLEFISFQVSAEIIVSWAMQSLAQNVLAGSAAGCVADGVTVRVKSRLAAPPDQVWQLLLSKETLLFITRGMMTFTDSEDWPEPLFSPGTKIDTRVRLFGRGPAFPHQVRIVRVDETKREIDTEEDGGLLDIWNHRMHVEAVSSEESLYTDHIELRAGLITPVIWSFAFVYYRYRHRRWRELLVESNATI
jgi:ligand-binding SRPBCC domain-containing protein